MLTRPVDTALPIRSIRPGDIPAAMELVRTAGWNQTKADWRFMLAEGQGFGIADEHGRLVASSVVLPYPPDIGWIGMVLVAPEMRRQGFATRLMHNAIATIRAAGRVPMLDATPAGAEVYGALGFRALDGIARWRGAGRGTKPATLGMTKEQLDAGIIADAAAFGADRRHLLRELHDRPDAISLVLPDRRGWLWSRAGRTATQVGPIVSASPADAVELCAAALDRIADAVIVDVPDRETELADFLRSRGFALERKLTRMALDAASATRASITRAIAGPELG